jgi:glycosyltransferase involved in cell wall biosynthesis
LKVARRRPDIHFVFLNTAIRPPRFRPFPENIHFLPTTVDPVMRSRFINTCDAMLHARRSGETFGLACAEFSAHNKPVITYAKSKCQAHIDMLGGTAITYRTPRELAKTLLQFRPDPAKHWDVVTDAYSPENVMRRFDQVFLKGASARQPG